MSLPRLIIQTEKPEEEASRTTSFLRHVILRQGVGMDPMEVIIDPPNVAQYPGVPLVTMGKEPMAAWMNGEKRIAEFHGHIHMTDGRLVCHTFDAFSCIKQPNYLPLVIQEISNLLAANRSPKILDRPYVHQNRDLPKVESCTFDLEWDSKCRVSVVGVSYDGQEAYSTQAVGPALKTLELIASQGHTLIGHNIIAADFQHMSFKPKSYKPEHVFDTKVAAHLVHPHWASMGVYDLGSLVRYYFPTEDWKHSGDKLLVYNGYDCVYSARLAKALKRDLEMTKQMHLMEHAQEMQALTVEMHKRGVAIDGAALCKFIDNYAEEKNALKVQLPINPNSPKQVKEWLKGKKIFVPNIQADTLEKLRGKDPQVDTLIEYRTDVKSPSTWFDYEKDKIGRVVGWEPRIFPKFNATGTAVDRLSSAEPNFQNLPPEMRHMIVASDPGTELVSMDASQAENRWVAYYAGDEEMQAAFDAGLDIHQYNADKISKAAGFDCARNFAKTVVHASNYGETATHLAERLFGNRKFDSLKKATALQNGYFKAFPKTRQWQKDIEKQLDSGDTRMVNAYGRQRCIYAVDSHERKKRGCHFLGCSSSAMMVNRCAIRIWKEMGLVPILIVHDELVYEIERDRKDLWIGLTEILSARMPEQGDRPGVWEMKRGLNYGKKSEKNPNGLEKLKL